MSTTAKKQDDSAKRVPLPAKVRPDIRSVVEEIASEADRSVSNMVEHLLAESPKVKRRLSQLSAV